jgi:RNA polymerase sigma factor (sigma-70 family)
MMVYTNKDLFDALISENTEGLRSLKKLVLPRVVAFCKKYGVPGEAAEEVTHDSMLILMEDIDNGKYFYEGKCPSLYATKVGQYLVLNLSKSKYTRKDKVQDLSAAEHFIGFDDIEKRLHNTMLLEQLMEHTQDRCQQLITLKYLQEYSYEQIITLQLTHYQSVAAVKNATSQCMAKLVETAKSLGLKYL